MEFYTLDDQLRKDQVVEGYESFIWTERYSGYGDFQININATPQTRALLAVDTLLALDESYYVMKIETVSDAVGDDGAENLEITGRSLEAMLDDRVAMPAISISDLATNPKWVITGTPGDVARTIFNTICVDLALDPGDGIPFYTPGTLLPHGSIPEETSVITVNLDPDSVYNSIKKICDTYVLGFRLIRNFETSQLYFDIYTGDDLTSGQTVRNPVIFGPDLDNLSDTTRLISNAQYKTIAYVFGKDEVAIVFGVGADTTPVGFDRKVLVVQDITVDSTTVPDVGEALSQIGLQALAQHQKVFQFDGKISQLSSYKYGVDYVLGDLVEERDSSGFGNQMRVTEQIFVSDSEGDRSYPTLTLTLTLVPGTWSEVTPPDKVWADEPLDQFWGNQ